MSVLPSAVSAFIGSAVHLPVESFGTIRQAVAEATAAGVRDSSQAPKLGAADFSALSKHVRDALEPRASELRSVQPGSLRAALANITIAAQAIWKREALTAEQFDSYAGVFRTVGITLD